MIKVGRITTIVGLLISAAAAYTARQFDNIMDMLQLVFGFVNAPLFAIFLLGMFWRRTTGHGAFFGLLVGTVTAMIFQGLTLPMGEHVGVGALIHLSRAGAGHQRRHNCRAPTHSARGEQLDHQ